MSIWLNVSVYKYPNTCRMKKEEITSFSHLNFFNCFFFFSTKQVTLLINNMKFIKYKKKEKFLIGDQVTNIHILSAVIGIIFYLILDTTNSYQI